MFECNGVFVFLLGFPESLFLCLLVSLEVTLTLPRFVFRKVLAFLQTECTFKMINPAPGEAKFLAQLSLLFLESFDLESTYASGVEATEVHITNIDAFGTTFELF